MNQQILSKFEQIATERNLKMSDGSTIRVLTHRAPEESRNNLTMFMIGGWGTIVDRWDNVTLEAMKDFDVVYFESREKHSSILVKGSISTEQKI